MSLGSLAIQTTEGCFLGFRRRDHCFQEARQPPPRAIHTELPRTVEMGLPGRALGAGNRLRAAGKHLHPCGSGRGIPAPVACRAEPGAKADDSGALRSHGISLLGLKTSLGPATPTSFPISPFWNRSVLRLPHHCTWKHVTRASLRGHN